MARVPGLVYAATLILKALNSPRSRFRLEHAPNCRAARRPTRRMADVLAPTCGCGLERFHRAVARFHQARRDGSQIPGVARRRP